MIRTFNYKEDTFSSFVIGCVLPFSCRVNSRRSRCTKHPLHPAAAHLATQRRRNIPRLAIVSARRMLCVAVRERGIFLGCQNGFLWFKDISHFRAALCQIVGAIFLSRWCLERWWENSYFVSHIIFERVSITSKGLLPTLKGNVSNANCEGISCIKQRFFLPSCRGNPV